MGYIGLKSGSPILVITADSFKLAEAAFELHLREYEEGFTKEKPGRYIGHKTGATYTLSLAT